VTFFGSVTGWSATLVSDTLIRIDTGYGHKIDMVFSGAASSTYVINIRNTANTADLASSIGGNRTISAGNTICVANVSKGFAIYDNVYQMWPVWGAMNGENKFTCGTNLDAVYVSGSDIEWIIEYFIYSKRSETLPIFSGIQISSSEESYSGDPSQDIYYMFSDELSVFPGVIAEADGVKFLWVCSSQPLWIRY
jgi:hypothetical protein